MNKYQTYSLIGKILALDVIPAHRAAIIQSLEKDDVHWQRFIALADHHLILQTLYPKIRDHNLQEYFPEELTGHLKYIFDLSMSRNLEVIVQTKKITDILNKENITPLYLKGVGNILDGLYKNPGERILQDIDLLVKEESFEKAAEILLQDGYQSNHKYNSAEKRHHRHYPILFKQGEPLYVEIHWLPVGPMYEKYFNTDMVFAKAKHPDTDCNCLVMSDEHKIIHNFIHAQLDHRGHFYALESMRNLYDLFLLSQKTNAEKVLYDFGKFRRASSGYLDISYDTFGNIPSYRKSPVLFLHFFLLRYFLNIRYHIVGVSSLFLIRVFSGFILKPLQALSDNKIRKKLVKKLKDPGWYKKQGDYYRKFFETGRNK